MSDVDDGGAAGDDPGPAYCLPFEACDGDDVATVGGKVASLGALIDAGAPVPPGFAVTTAFYRAFLAHNDLDDVIDGRLADLDGADGDGVAAAASALREAIQSAAFSPELDDALAAAWADLAERSAGGALRVAVRSSATAEDTPDASFAGQYDTYLNVVDGPGLRDRIRDCMASLFTERAITYRERNGIPHDDVAISVGVQQLISARAAGVMFTLNPANGDRSKVLIEGAWGLGEAVVDGDVTPDNFLVDKPMGTIVERTISTKSTMTVLADDGVETVAVEPERRDQPCLTDEEVTALAELGKEVERAFGAPQDIEWVIAEEPAGECFLLQSRPETAWND